MLLGVTVDASILTWQQQVQQLITECYHRVDILKVLSSNTWAGYKVLHIFYIGYI